jgi:hypothetical protein
VGARPGRATTIDLGRWLQQQPGGELDARLRPDGVHFTRDTAKEVARRWFGPAVLDAAARLPRGPMPPGPVRQ